MRSVNMRGITIAPGRCSSHLIQCTPARAHQFNELRGDQPMPQQRDRVAALMLAYSSGTGSNITASLSSSSTWSGICTAYTCRLVAALCRMSSHESCCFSCCHSTGQQAPLTCALSSTCSGRVSPSAEYSNMKRTACERMRWYRHAAYS